MLLNISAWESEVADLKSAWESEVAYLKKRIEELEKENQLLKDKIYQLEEVDSVWE